MRLRAREEYLKGAVSSCLQYEGLYLQKLGLAENVCKEEKFWINEEENLL
jgi:hypothetical protein